jgi:peroxiredoxin
MLDLSPMYRVLMTAALCGLVVTVAACPSRSSGTPSPRNVSARGGSIDRSKPAEMVLQAMGGGEVRLSEFRGRPLVLFFFTTWCVVCQVQVARLQPVRAALGNDRVAVLGVSLDLQRTLVPHFVRAAGFNFPVAFGRTSMVRKSSLGAIRGVPRTIILNAKGKLVADFKTPVSSKVLLDTLKPLVKR